MLLIVSATVCAFLRVTVFAALVVSSTWLPNPRLVGVSETGAMPAPVREMDWGLLEAVSVTVNVAVRLPRADGVNVTVILQLAPAPSVLGLIGQFPPHA
jgi:hypothetical protein